MFQVKLKSVYNDLTKSEKKIANFIMKNFEKTKTMTSYDISKKVNVGQATVIRFSKKLGYSSFNELINSSLVNLAIIFSFLSYFIYLIVYCMISLLRVLLRV